MNTRSKRASQMAISSAPAADAPFLVGTAISVWQNSGGEPTNWATWVDKKKPFGGSPIMGGDKVRATSAMAIRVLHVTL